MEESTGEERKARGARTQSLFRNENERVRHINQEFSSLVPLGDWVCECADTACSERIALSFDDYEAVRSNPRRFAAPGEHHFVSELERLVGRFDRYWTVEKYGLAGDVAAAVDPRTIAGAPVPALPSEMIDR